MSADSRPIEAAAFAEALQDLPLSSVYAKIAEIENSVAHLERSNGELRRFIEGSAGTERECEDAVVENEVVIKRMRDRIDLVKLELSRRGEEWPEAPTSNVEDGQQAESSAAGAGQTLPLHNGPPAGLRANGEPNGVPDGGSGNAGDDGVHL